MIEVFENKIIIHGSNHWYRMRWNMECEPPGLGLFLFKGAIDIMEDYEEGYDIEDWDKLRGVWIPDPPKTAWPKPYV